MKAESCRWKSIHGCSLYTGSGLVLFFDFFPKSILELMWNQPSTFRVRLPSFAAGLWISRAAGSHHWWLLGGLQILVWQLGSSTLSGELLHLQLPQDTRARPELTETHTPNYSRQIINAWGRGGGSMWSAGGTFNSLLPLNPPPLFLWPPPPKISPLLLTQVFLGKIVKLPDLFSLGLLEILENNSNNKMHLYAAFCWLVNISAQVRKRSKEGGNR